MAFRKKNDDALSLTDALNRIAEGLLSSSNTIKVGSFWEFVRDIWSKGYEHPEYFFAYHVGLICTDLDRAIADGKFYVAVLPRGHLKSTVLNYAAITWRMLDLIQKGATYTNALGLSFKDEMANYHSKEAKTHVNRNEELSKGIEDLAKTSESVFRYQVGKSKMEITTGGLFAFKRGFHTGAIVVVDDVLKDPENKMNLAQLYKIEEHFMAETIYIPNPGTPLIVLGTPMAPDDLLNKLCDDERFYSRVLPALNPEPNRYILFPEKYSKEYLETEKRKNKAFNSEFMLAPHLSNTAGYFSLDELNEVTNSQLKNHFISREYRSEFDFVTAGYDVGKKRHPSHLVVMGRKDGKIINIHQSFIDGMSYDKQAELLNEVAEVFRVNIGYYDNTRAELEDRGLKPAWKPFVFTEKNKLQAAKAFDKYVSERTISLIDDERFRSQIVCVDSNLQAPETPMGHGDSFFSCALSLLAQFEAEGTGKRTQTVGNLQSLIDTERSDSFYRTAELDYNKIMATCPSCSFPLSGENCTNCNWSGKLFCPECGRPEGWILKNQKCLSCYWKGVMTDVR